MKKGAKKIRIPNPHSSEDVHVSLVKEILRQAGIGNEEWDNEEDEDIDCNNLMTPDECSCFDECMWNGETGNCDSNSPGRVSNQLYAQRYENIVEELSNNNDGECFSFNFNTSTKIITFTDEFTDSWGNPVCEMVTLSPTTPGI